MSDEVEGTEGLSGRVCIYVFMKLIRSDELMCFIFLKAMVRWCLSHCCEWEKIHFE